MKPGYLYLIRNKKLKARKVGICASILELSSRYGKDWEILYLLDGYSMDTCKATENIVLAFVRELYGVHKKLEKSDLRYGHTETFGFHKIKNRVLIQIIRETADQIENQLFKINVTH